MFSYEKFQLFWTKFWIYFFSVYENTILQALLFVSLLTLLYALRHIYLNWFFLLKRSKIPLVIGGWGTRGKSGTERLKCAIFNAMGYSVSSKTTGCEALFLTAYRFDNTYELPVYRSYDKATIWEQHGLTTFAADLKSDVFLWECMGLKKDYVNILQNGWMRDDLSTITNTYPDHEDQQGPSGYNVAETIATFVPKNSTLITSEEQMLPILKEQARKNGTVLKPVTWKEIGLLTPDILERFPYLEHSANVALVSSLAAEMGLSQEFALKEMADRVVPDTGVFKTYPVSILQTCYLEFTNGMSANDKYTCLSNWKRAGFDRYTHQYNPESWVSCLVNNRVDRVSRSQDFAEILVNEIQADAYFIVGTNIEGFVSYVNKAWDNLFKSFTLWPSQKQQNLEITLAIFDKMLEKYRIIMDEAVIQLRLKMMIEYENKDKSPDETSDDHKISDNKNTFNTDELISKISTPEFGHLLLQSSLRHKDLILKQYQKDMNNYNTFASLKEKIKIATEDQYDSLNAEFVNLLHHVYNSKFVLVLDHAVSADKLTHLIEENTPIGLTNRMMGLQNIKGPGLVFVHALGLWEKCYAAGLDMLSEDARLVSKALRTLQSIPKFNLLSLEYIKIILAKAEHSLSFQQENLRIQLTVLRINYNTAVESVTEELRVEHHINPWIAKFFMGIESFLDVGDSIRRKKEATKIYKQLTRDQISYEQAISELRALVERQQGGWLLIKVIAFKEYLAAIKRSFTQNPIKKAY